MNKNEGVEYCNVDLRFDRRAIHTFIKSFIQEGYAMYWSETETQFIASVRSGVKMIKLKFYRVGDRFKLVGNYVFHDEKMAFLMEKMIGATRGHAVVKRMREKHILIENIMFGEVIRSVEMTHVDHQVIDRSDVHMPLQTLGQTFFSDRIEKRIVSWHEEVDELLLRLHRALQSQEHIVIADLKKRLALLQQERLLLEV